MKIRGLLITTCVLGGCVVGWYSATKKNTNAFKKILVRCNPPFSKKIQQAMISFAQEQEKVTVPPALLTTLVQETFPAVKAVQVSTGPGSSLRVQVTPHDPVAVLNDKKILTKAGTLFNVTDLQDSLVAHLPTIAITQKDKPLLQVSDSCRRFINRCLGNLAKDYTVMWYDPTRVELKDKKDAQFTVLATHDTNFSEELLQQYERLKEKVKANGKARWYVDVRFKNQMIVFAQKGERG